MTRDYYAKQPWSDDPPTSVSVENVKADLAKLDEDTVTHEYGYYLDDDGELIVQVWTDAYHGSKAEYKVNITLEKMWGREGYDWHG